MTDENTEPEAPQKPRALFAVGGQVLDAAEAPPPADRRFRSAWKLSGGVVTVDMARARDLHRDRLRQARLPLLAALDVEYMRALERDDRGAMGMIAARKAILRDVTDDQRISAASTPDDLAALTIETLT